MHVYYSEMELSIVELDFDDVKMEMVLELMKNYD